MARRTWKDRVVEKPRTFNVQNNADGTITLIPAPGQIVEPGTPVNAANLNGLEDDLVNHIGDDVTHVPYAAATGTANTYAVSLNPAPTAYVEGMALSVKINVDSTGASTINVNNLGAKSLKKANGTDVTNLKTNGVYTFRYNATTGNFILQGEGGEYGSAGQGDVRNTKTIGTENGVVPGTLDLSNLVPENIKKGVVIDGKTGTFTDLTSFTASDTVLYQDLPQVSSYVGSPTVAYQRVKFFRVAKNSGTIRLKFTGVSGTGDTVAFKVLKNSSIVYSGNLQTSSTNYTIDITVNTNDTIEIQVIGYNASYGLVSNMYVCGNAVSYFSAS